MKGNTYICFSLFSLFEFLFFILLVSCNTRHTNQLNKAKGADEEAFIHIFNGRSLEGWQGDSTYWRVEEGNLIGEVTPATLLKRNSFLIWRGGTLTDFELKVEYKVSKAGNSGINYRSEEVPDVPFALRGYQADLDGAQLYTGSNYEERGRTTLASRGDKVVLETPYTISVSTPSSNQDSIKAYSRDNMWTKAKVVASLGNKDSLAGHIKMDGWNEYHLIVKGYRLQHYVNGILMSEVTDNDTINRKSKGLLGVQVHVGPPMTIAYRNFRLKKL